MLVNIAIVLMLLYALLMVLYRIGWHMQPDFSMPGDYIPQTKISVIIPARNEENNIVKCLDAILSQNYPTELLEVLVVDDHSTDGTTNIVAKYNRVKCVKAADFPNAHTVAFKKRALSIGIANSIGELIVTTDADCYMGTSWLKSIACKYEEEHPAMIIAPVSFETKSSLLQVFQSIDFMSMQGIGFASLQLGLGNMSNGANLAFQRKVFDAVGGYEGIDHIASGDDYLLMTKINKAYPKQIKCLKSDDAIVSTLPQLTWNDFLQQRIRWASKSGKYDDTKLTLVLLLVYVTNLSLLLTLLFCGITVTFELIFLKIIVELIYLFPVAGFFKKRWQLWLFPFLQPFHILYIILAGFMGYIGIYKWKGRIVR